MHLILLLLGSTASFPAAAHSLLGDDPHEQAAAWLSGLLLAALWAAYAIGARRRPPATGPMLCFYLGLLLSFFAVLGPMDDWAAVSAAAHMTQHMLFMVVIAPLWVMGQPLPQLAAGPGRVSRGIWRPVLALTRRPMSAAWLHAAVIWFWHTPRYYMLAVEHPWWHAVEHAMFIASAAVFWWSVLRAGREGAPMALLALLFTLMHTGFLGALLTFAQAPLYGEARDLQDQQLAGLIMWVLGGLPYIIASAWVGQRWYRRLMRDSS